MLELTNLAHDCTLPHIAAHSFQLLQGKWNGPRYYLLIMTFRSVPEIPLM